MPVCFPMKDGEWEVLGGREGDEELEGVDGRESIIRIYCMKKMLIFNLYNKKKEKKSEMLF